MTLSATIKPTLVRANGGFHRDLLYAVISDVHFFHNKTSTGFIIDNIDKMFEGYEPTASLAALDALFIAGDLFEKQGLLEEDAWLVTTWVFRLFDFCAQHNIVVRVLEGTPSHDVRQSRILETVATRYVGRLDFRYVCTLSVEVIESLGLSVLYVPDEWLGSTQRAQEDVERVMDETGYVQVDIAIMHGLFSFQVPELKKAHLKYDETFFLNKVKYFINIGHDHSPKIQGRIIVQGSFDRLAHGQEHPKGMCLCYLRQDGDHGYVMLENKWAKIYTTLQVRLLDIEKALATVQKRLSALPPDSHVVIKAKTGHPILQNIPQLRKLYPFLNITKEGLDEDNEQKKGFQVVLDTPDYIPTQLTKENIVERTIHEIISKTPLSPEHFGALSQMLDKLC